MHPYAGRWSVFEDIANQSHLMPESDAILPAHPFINVLLPQECYFSINEMRLIFEIDGFSFY